MLWFIQWRCRYTCILHISIACPADIILPRTCTGLFLAGPLMSPDGSGVKPPASPCWPPRCDNPWCAPSPGAPVGRAARVTQTTLSRFSPLLWVRTRETLVCCLLSVVCCLPCLALVYSRAPLWVSLTSLLLHEISCSAAPPVSQLSPGGPASPTSGWWSWWLPSFTPKWTGAPNAEWLYS